MRKGQQHSEETKRKISTSKKDVKLSDDHKRKIGESNKGNKFPKKFGQEISERQKGKKNTFWKGGYSKRGIPTYDTYAPQIEWCEEVRRNKEDPNVLEVKCFKCKEWYIPKLWTVRNRIQVLKNTNSAELHFYCSKECKNSCSIYGKTPETLMKQDAVRAGRLPWLELGREVQIQLRSMVLERDEYKCVKCNNISNLQCHHIYPVSINPLESADINNCITLCDKCHKEAHKKDGCGYNQLHLKEC